jgi:hypothetical protein
VADPYFSPAEHLDTVAVSEANAWRDAVVLCARRMRAGEPSQQTDARLFVLALRLVVRVGELAANAVGGCPDAARIVAEAQDRFARACPDADKARNVLEHFDQYAAGAGNMQTGGRNKLPQPEKAAADWPFGYDPQTDQIRVGRYLVDVGTACEQTRLMAFDVARAVRAYEDAGRPAPR